MRGEDWTNRNLRFLMFFNEIQRFACHHSREVAWKGCRSMLQTERANRVFDSHLEFSSKEQQRITMAPHTSWCCEQRRAESPIRIQPRAAPWVKIFQQTCALKEQKEGERTSISLSPVALTARQLVNELTPRVLPWAVFLLGLRPVLAYNIGCRTLRWAVFFLELHPLIACIVAAARFHIYHYKLVRRGCMQ